MTKTGPTHRARINANGISCCGITLNDGTDLMTAYFVLDQGKDPLVMQKPAELKGSTS
jgi:hypothetical protein